MLSLKLIYLSFYLIINGVLISCDHIIPPCNINDDACVTRSAKTVWPVLMDGIPSLGVEPADPLSVPMILGDLSILKYNFTDTVATGFKGCDINSIKLDLDKSKMNIDMACKLYLQGHYTISGRLIILPIEGDGKFKITTNKHHISVELDLKKVQGKDGTSHMKITSFKTKVEPTDNVIFDFANLFNGRKDLSEAVHHFANENWKEVTEFVQEPVFLAVFKKIVSIANKYLKTIPYDDLFIQ